MVKGQKVFFFEKASKRRRKGVLCTVKGFTRHLIVLSSPSGYTISVKINDARRGICKFFQEDGKQIRFKPLPDIKKIEEEAINKEMEEYRKVKCIRRDIPKKDRVSQKYIMELHNQGLSDIEISTKVRRGIGIIHRALSKGNKKEVVVGE